MTWFQIVWIVLFATGAVVEVLALRSDRRQDTLSEQVWALRAVPVVRFLLLPFWFWLTWHFFFEPSSMDPYGTPVWWDDLIVIAVGIGSGLFLRYSKHTA